MHKWFQKPGLALFDLHLFVKVMWDYQRHRILLNPFGYVGDLLEGF